MTLRLFIVFCVTCWLSACAGLPTSRSDTTSDHSPDASPVSEPETYRPIPANTLYSLLVAEVAGQRQRYDISLYHYMSQARRTQDGDIAERAARIAQYVGSAELADEAIEIWRTNKPEDPAAYQAAAQMAMERGDFSTALQHLEKLLTLANISQFDYLAANAARHPKTTQQHILQALQPLSEKYPNNANLWQAQAILEQQIGAYEQALQHTDHALQLQPEFLSARIQKARLLTQMQRIDDAIDWLTDLEATHPENKSIAILRARLFLQQGDIAKALNAFTRLHNRFPDDTAILLSLALLEEEAGKTDQAKQHLQQLLHTNSHTNEAHFYLGKIARSQHNDPSALKHFQQVSGGREFLAAQLQAAELLHKNFGIDSARDYLSNLRHRYPRQAIALTRIEVQLLIGANQKKAAMRLLTTTLENNPKDHDLLYTRAMLAEQLDNLELLESDLRFLISLKPDHAEALNALGYTLADRTQRWDEALPLVEKALELSPNNPAVIDSLGWIHFRRGDIDRARPLLKQAFELLDDHEIAAHYGELLWISGEHQQARDVWRQGLENTPNSKIIQRTLQRLQVDNPPLIQPE